MSDAPEAGPQKDPFEEGERAAAGGIPAEGNPYQDGTEEYALWSAGHERVAGEMEKKEAGNT